MEEFPKYSETRTEMEQFKLFDAVEHVLKLNSVTMSHFHKRFCTVTSIRSGFVCERGFKICLQLINIKEM